jgi:2-dehydropantoate 2-reductase
VTEESVKEADVKLERVCIIGAGVIGSLCAAHLAREADVSVLVRRGEHAAALNEHGLTVTGKSNLTSPVFATTDPSALPEFDLGIVATKATQMDDAVAPFAGRFPKAAFMTIQNGIGAELLMARYGDWPLISSVTFMSGIRHGDHRIEYELDTATWLGPFRPSGASFARATSVAELFVASGLKAEALPDVRPAQWSKLIFNHAVNSVAAITDLPHVALYARRDKSSDLGWLVAGLIEEGAAVATAAGVELFEDPWDMNVHAVTAGRTDSDDYAHVPSMLGDIRAGRKTEIEFITGAIVREAARFDVEVPLSRAMYQLVRARDRSYDD